MRDQAAIMRMRVLALALVMAAFSVIVNGQTTEAQDPQQKLVIPTTDVTVQVIVTDRYGRFVTGLRQADFSVREDGLLQKVEKFSDSTAPFNVALLIDTSRSTQNKLGAIRKAAQAFIKQLQPNDRVMIVTFDEHVRFISELTNNRAELDRAVKSLKSSYMTSLYDAISQTITERLNKIQGRKAIVILTDGVDTASKRASFESTLEMVSATGIICYAIQYETRNDGVPISRPLFFPNGGGGQRFRANFVGSSPREIAQDPPVQTESEKKEQGKPLINLPRPSTSVINGDPPTSVPGNRPMTRVNSQGGQPLRDRYLIATDFLHSLAVQSGALHIRAENIENTSFAFQRIAEELRNQYTLAYISSNEQRDGKYRSIAVGLKVPDLVVRARHGYRVPKADPADEAPSERKAPAGAAKPNN